jgi:hypothetical protein
MARALLAGMAALMILLVGLAGPAAAELRTGSADNRYAEPQKPSPTRPELERADLRYDNQPGSLAVTLSLFDPLGPRDHLRAAAVAAERSDRRLPTRVDLEGGHVLGTSLQGLRLAQGTLDPRAVAALLPSESNPRLPTGATIPRVNVRELELPVLSHQESAMLMDLLDALEREQAAAQELVQGAATVRSAVVAALSTGAVAIRGSNGGVRDE